MLFHDKLIKATKKNNSLLCVGLDSDIEKLPYHIKKKRNPLFFFNKKIIDATHDLVCTFKPNIAFYEAYGIDGLKQLKLTIEYIQKQYSEIPIILDAKRGDIGNTAARYAKAVYEYWNVDGVTIFPYLGFDAISPFLAYKNKLTILLLKTSNPDSETFQNLNTDTGDPFYLRMAKKIKSWPQEGIGLFVGATFPSELSTVRKLFPTTTFLTAGVGAQGAKTKEAVKAGVDTNGNNLICNNSREILYASSNVDFAQKAREKAILIKDEINKWRK